MLKMYPKKNLFEKLKLIKDTLRKASQFYLSIIMRFGMSVVLFSW